MLKCKRCKALKLKIAFEKKTNYNICLSCYNGARYIGKQNRINSITFNEARKLVLAYFGAICNCCGENEEAFLDLDHVNNDGATHRKELDGLNTYVWLVQNNFDTKYEFQILCCNCNQGKARSAGICPHERNRIRLVS